MDNNVYGLTHTVPSLQGTLAKPAMPRYNQILPKSLFAHPAPSHEEHPSTVNRLLTE